MVSVALTTEKKKAASKQSRRFIKKARELECDEDERVFDEKLGRLAKVGPKRVNSPKKEDKNGA